MKIILYSITVFILVLLNPGLCFAQKDSHRKVEPGSYDIIEKKTLTIQTDYEYDKFNINNSFGSVNLTTDLKYATLPTLTISYGLFKRLEVSFFTGITAMLTNNKVTISLLNERTFTLDKNIIGIDGSGFGLKFGILTAKKLRPSLNLESDFTMPFIGEPLFRPDNVGADISLSMNNAFGEHFDVSYYVGSVWSGYNADPYVSGKYTINPGVTITDELYTSVDLTTYVAKRYSPWSKLTFAVDYDFNDYISGEISGGTTFYKSYTSNFLGFSGTFIIDFNKEKE